MNVGQGLCQVLQQLGAGAIFGVPGGQTLPLYGATRSAGLPHVVMRDERNAACAADAYARVSGSIGICDATVGPGVTNLISGLAESLAASVPVLALVADIRSDQQHLRRRSVASQALDQTALLIPVTKWTVRLECAEALEATISQAVRVATSGRPGPVAVEIPENVWTEEMPAPGASQRRSTTASPTRPAPTAAAISAVVDLLDHAARPVILAGGGVISSDASSALSALAEKAGIPVCTTINGKGSIDERHRLAMGVVGLFGHQAATSALDGADVVLVVGSKLDQMSTHQWRLPRPDQEVIHIDIDGEEIGRTCQPSVAVVADAREALDALCDGTSARARVDWPPELSAPERAGTDDGALHPADVCEAIDAVLTPNDVVVCDASYSSGWGAAHLRIAKPRHFVAPRGLAGIGWSPGAAIGARLAAPPESRLVVLAGDGGWAYGCAELETAARWDLDITYVILNNSSLAWIVHGEERMGINPLSTFTEVDFAEVARGFNVRASSVDTLEDLRSSLTASRQGRGPEVIDVRSSASVAPTVSLRRARAKLASA